MHATDAAGLPRILRARFCVIGSGMAGSMLCEQLVRAGLDVLLVEAGDLSPMPEADADDWAEHDGLPFRIPQTRCIEVGGTSNLWHGICGRLDDEDFAARPWIEGSGWPIGPADLEGPYREAAVVHALAQAPPRQFGELPESVRRGDGGFGFVADLLEHKLVAWAGSPLRWKARVQRLGRLANLRCLFGARALAFETSEARNSVRRLVVGVAARTIRIEADVFVVCAGALETPQLLLNSRDAGEAGLGNAHDQVGRCLMDHPAGHFCKIGFDRAVRAPLFSGMRVRGAGTLMAGLKFTSNAQRRFGVANHYLWLRPAVTPARIDDDLLLSFLRVRGIRDLNVRQVRAILRDADLRYRVVVHRLHVKPRYRYADLFFMTEQLPNPQSRVLLSDTGKDRYGYPVARIRWQLSREDLEGFERYSTALFERGLRGAGYSLARRDAVSSWPDGLASAAHHLGTARMADHPRRGVVDRNLKVFGLSNLFVCDGSVFPTAGSVNPSLTITALAIRLAAHLRQELALRSEAVDVLPA